VPCRPFSVGPFPSEVGRRRGAVAALFRQHEAYLHAEVPRVRCVEHGVRQVRVPWARDCSGFTLLFEALAMALMREIPVRAAAKILGEHDTRLWRVLLHYVRPPLAFGKMVALTRLVRIRTSLVGPVWPPRLATRRQHRTGALDRGPPGSSRLVSLGGTRGIASS